MFSGLLELSEGLQKRPGDRRELASELVAKLAPEHRFLTLCVLNSFHHSFIHSPRSLFIQQTFVEFSSLCQSQRTRGHMTLKQAGLGSRRQPSVRLLDCRRKT